MFAEFDDGVRLVDIYYSRNNKNNNGEGIYQMDNKGHYKEELFIDDVKIINRYDVKCEKVYLLFVPSDGMSEKDSSFFKGSLLNYVSKEKL